MNPGARVATIAALVATAVLGLLIYVGSRGLRDFDSALIGYAVASLFALAAAVYRYTLWISRPPTWRYFKAGWQNDRRQSGQSAFLPPLLITTAGCFSTGPGSCAPLRLAASRGACQTEVPQR